MLRIGAIILIEKDPLQSSPKLFNHLIDVEYGDILLIRNTPRKWLRKLPFIKHKEFCGIGIFMSGNTVITINRFLQEEARLFNSEDYVIMRHINSLSPEDKKMMHNCLVAYMIESKRNERSTKLKSLFSKINRGLFSSRIQETNFMISEIYLRAGKGLQIEAMPLDDLPSYYHSRQLKKVFDSREA